MKKRGPYSLPQNDEQSTAKAQAALHRQLTAVDEQYEAERKQLKLDAKVVDDFAYTRDQVYRRRIAQWQDGMQGPLVERYADALEQARHDAYRRCEALQDELEEQVRQSRKRRDDATADLVWQNKRLG